MELSEEEQHGHSASIETRVITAAGEVANSVSVAHNQPTDPGAGKVEINGGDLTVGCDLNLGDLTFPGFVHQ